MSGKQHAPTSQSGPQSSGPDGGRSPQNPGQQGPDAGHGGDLAFLRDQVQADLAEIPTFLSGLMGEAAKAGGAIRDPDVGVLQAAGAAASSNGTRADERLLSAGEAVMAVSEEDRQTPEWAEMSGDVLAAEQRVDQSTRAAAGNFVVPGSTVAASAGGAGAAISSAMSAVMPEVISAAGIKGAAKATASLTGDAARGAAEALQRVIAAHPGNKTWAKQIALSNAGGEVTAYLTGGPSVDDGELETNGLSPEEVEGEDDAGKSDDAADKASEEAGKMGPKTGGSAKTGDDVDVSKPKEGTRAEGGPGTGSYENTHDDGDRSQTAKIDGKIDKNGATGGAGLDTHSTDDDGTKRKTSSNGRASVDSKKVKGDLDRETQTEGPDGKKRTRHGGASMDTDGKAELRGGTGTTTDGGLDVGVSGSGSADFKMNEDGTVGLDGASVAVTTKVGPVQVSGQFSYRDKLTGPIKQGSQYMVTIQRTFTAGASGGGAGKNGGVSVNAQHTQTVGATKLFGSAEEAQALVDSGVAVGIPTVPDIVAPDLEQMKEGETLTMSEGTDFGLDGSVSSGAVSAGVSASAGQGRQVQVTKGKDGKVEVTVMDLSRSGAGANAGAVVTVDGSMGSGKASHTAVELDLSTEEGRDAYARWSKNPEAVPSGAGTSVTSKGSGHSSRTGKGISVAGDVATAQEVSETGYYEEELQDGSKRTQRTWYGHNENHAKVTGAEDDKRKHGLTIRETTGEDGEKSTTYTLRSEVKADSAAAAQEGLVEAEGDRHTKDVWAEGESGKTYTVEEEVKEEHVDNFAEKVASGDYQPDPGDTDLQDALKKAGNDPDARKEVLVQYFADKGPDAIRALKECPGNEDMAENERDYAIDGDDTVTGSVGRQRVQGEIADLRRRIADGEDVNTVQSDVRKLYSTVAARQEKLRNPAAYPGLPDAARTEILKGIGEDLRQLAGLLRDNDQLRAHETGEAAEPSKALTVAHSKVQNARQICQASMGRAEVSRRLLRQGGSASVRGKAGGQDSFASGDQHWNKGQSLYPKACDAYTAYLAVDPHGPGGDSAAVAAADAATKAYVDAAAEFRSADQVYASIVRDASDRGMVDTSNPRPLPFLDTSLPPELQ